MAPTTARREKYKLPAGTVYNPLSIVTSSGPGCWMLSFPFDMRCTLFFGRFCYIKCVIREELDSLMDLDNPFLHFYKPKKYFVRGQIDSTSRL